MQPFLSSHQHSFNCSLFREHRVIFQNGGGEAPQQHIEKAKTDLATKQSAEDIKNHIEDTLKKIEASGNAFINKKMEHERIAVGSILNSEKVQPAIDAFRNYKIETKNSTQSTETNHNIELQKLGHNVLDELTKVLQHFETTQATEKPEEKEVSEKKEAVRKLLNDRVLAPTINELYGIENTEGKKILTNSQHLLEIALGQIDKKDLTEKTPSQIIALAVPNLQEQVNEVENSELLVRDILKTELKDVREIPENFVKTYAAEIASKYSIQKTGETIAITGSDRPDIILNLKEKLGIDNNNTINNEKLESSLNEMQNAIKQAQGSKMMLERIKELTAQSKQAEKPAEEGLMNKIVKFIQAIMGLMEGKNMEWGLGLLSGKSEEEMKESDRKNIEQFLEKKSPDDLKKIIEKPEEHIMKAAEGGQILYQGKNKLQSAASEKLGTIYATKSPSDFINGIPDYQTLSHGGMETMFAAWKKENPNIVFSYTVDNEGAKLSASLQGNEIVFGGGRATFEAQPVQIGRNWTETFQNIEKE